MLQRWEKPASTRGALLGAPCLAGAPWLPSGRGFKGFTQSSGRGKLQFIPCPAFSPCPACQSWCTGDRFQGWGLRLDFLRSSDLTTNSPEGWWQREGWGCISFPVRTRPAGAETQLSYYTEGSFVFVWRQSRYKESKGGSALKIYLYIKGKSRSHWNCLQQVERIIQRTNIALTDIQMGLVGKPQRL